MVDRTYSDIDHNVEETEEMRVYRINYWVGFTNKQVNKN